MGYIGLNPLSCSLFASGWISGHSCPLFNLFTPFIFLSSFPDVLEIPFDSVSFKNRLNIFVFTVISMSS